jgi:phospholipid/cholesterol/gamma-HCH transport system permease protein
MATEDQTGSLRPSYWGKTTYFLETVGGHISLFFSVFATVLRRPPRWELVREQLYEVGVMSLGVVAITGFTTGFVLAVQSFYQLGDKGMGSMTGLLVSKSMIAELGPILTAFMVTGRVGSAMCAEIGSMKVTEQIDALRSMSVQPTAYLITPRIIACMFMVPILSLFNILMGILGGFFIASFFQNMSLATFLEPMRTHITLLDCYSSVVKAATFGTVIAVVCCYKGLQATGGAAGVGKATTQSVVTSYILVLVFDFLLTLGLNR